MFLWHLAFFLVRQFPIHITRGVAFQLLRVLVYRFGLRFPTAQVDGFLAWLRQLSGVDWLAIWDYKCYSEVADKLISKGLGARGCCPIPLGVWEEFVSPGFLLELRRAGPLFPKREVRLAGPVKLLVRTLLGTGFLVRRDGVLPNCSVFVIPKASEKVSMIAVLRYLNLVFPRPMPRFVLPTVQGIMGFVALFPPGYCMGC